MAGKDLHRVKAFSQRNLFADPDAVDDEWMAMCREGSRDTRSRHATFAYLVGTVPGGVWRDDRSALLAALSVPCQVLRGDGVEGAAARLAAFEAAVPQPSCCALVPGGRAVLPYENVDVVCALLATYLSDNFDTTVGELVKGAHAPSTRSE